MGLKLQGEVLLPGTARGPALRLSAPISFWGGVDPASGKIVQAKHPDRGAVVVATVLAIDRTIGSSSSSAVLLELLYQEMAPAALILGRPDAILSLGVIVAAEMGYPTIPVIRCPLDGIETGMTLSIDSGGLIESVD
jgi:predicted aconitase with swiveling domain